MSEVIGIAGPYCAGKSAAARFFVQRGYREVDVDSLGHEARAARKDEVRREFGTDDRRRLREIVFASSDALARLEAILHPWMRERVAREVETARRSSEKLVINAALLFPMELDVHCDRVLWITAPACIRYLRARRRDGIGLQDFLRRMRSQKKLYPQKGAQDVDIITIVNFGSPVRLERRLAGIIERLKYGE